MNTIEAESIRGEEADPGQVAVTGHEGIDGKTATMFVPGGETLYSRSLPHSFILQRFIGYTLSTWVKVMLKMDDKVRHLHCDIESVTEAVCRKGRKNLAGLVALGQDV